MNDTTNPSASDRQPVPRVWGFSVDWHIPPLEEQDPDAPPTDADIAFDRMVEKARGFARKARPRRRMSGERP
ncbi:MAG TPA: hypothetical protein VMM78_02800 [Thermomicrobiales bacterium]|nr:hypothetical protein [Thermomicrobiales bacterium]